MPKPLNQPLGSFEVVYNVKLIETIHTSSFQELGTEYNPIRTSVTVFGSTLQRCVKVPAVHKRQMFQAYSAQILSGEKNNRTTSIHTVGYSGYSRQHSVYS